MTLGNIPFFIIPLLIAIGISFIVEKLFTPFKGLSIYVSNISFIIILSWKLSPLILMTESILSDPGLLLYAHGDFYGILIGIVVSIFYIGIKIFQKKISKKNIAASIILILLTTISLTIPGFLKDDSSIISKIEQSQLINLDGVDANIKYSKNPMILNFWATWCPPCQAEIPEIEAFYAQHSTSVDFYAINLFNTEKSKQLVEDFSHTHKMNIPVLLDHKQNLAKLFEITSVPTTIIIIPDRNEFKIHRLTGVVTKQGLERILSHVIY